MGTDVKKLHTTMMESRTFRGWERFDTYLVREKLKLQVITYKVNGVSTTELKGVRVEPDGREVHRLGTDYAEKVFNNSCRATREAVIAQHDTVDLAKAERAIEQFYYCAPAKPDAG